MTYKNDHFSLFFFGSQIKKPNEDTETLFWSKKYFRFDENIHKYITAKDVNALHESQIISVNKIKPPSSHTLTSSFILIPNNAKY